jgi:hypothetical protein
VARAKRTDRAEARRRYRAETAEIDGEDTSEDDAAAVSSPTDTKRPAARPAAMPAGRIGIGAAFRQSIHPLDVRADLAALPWLATHTKALWVPVLVTVAASVAVLFTGGSDVISAFFFAYFVQTPAIGGVFIAGFLAPRASWLLGIIVGLVSALGYTTYVLVVASRTVPAPDPDLVRTTIISSFVLSPVMGAVFASGAAWYRRFLQLSNPNRGRRPDPKRPTGNGRGRSQKASARR